MTDKGVPFSISILVTRRLQFSRSGQEDFYSDSLVPSGDTALINTNADQVAIKLTSEFLSGGSPANKSVALDGSNRDQGNRVYKQALDSSPKDSFMDLSNSGGASQAASLKASYGLA